MPTETKIETGKTRLGFLDIAKALALLTILIVHTQSPAEEIPFWMKVMASFSVQLFFMVCGMTSRVKDGFSFKSFLKYVGENAFSLILPYFVWSLIYMPFNIDSVRVILYGSTEGFIVYGPKCLQMWFLPCLFLAKVAMYGVLYIESKLKKNKVLVLLLITAIAFAIGFILPKLPGGYPWCVNIAFIALGIMIPAHLNYNFLSRIDHQPTWVQLIFFVVSGSLLIVGNILGTPEVGFMSMCTSDYGNPFWFLFDAFCGIICVRAISSVISRIDIGSRLLWLKKSLSWIGQNTMGIFIMHFAFEVTFIVGKLPNALGLPSTSLIAALLGGLLGLAVSIALTLLINMVIPQLLGYKYTRKFFNE